MDITNIVAINTKKIREQKKLTLDSAASITGVSRSMLAQIEKGEVNPTISVLWKIANGYKVSFTSLVENNNNTISVIKESDINPLTENDDQYINYPIFLFNENTLFETYRIVIKEGGSLSSQPHLNCSEEYITVFSGQVEINVEDKSFCLSKGDSIKFQANVPHSYKNIGKETVELSMLIYYNK